MQFENLSEKTLARYEKLFFEEICLLDTKGRDSFGIPLPEPLERIHFACVQDTVERLTEETHRLSTFQWRNCLFVPIDKSVRPNDVYEEVYDELKRRHPSLFIRSYVYVIFIKVYGGEALDLGIEVDDIPVSKDDLQIYAWNTNYEVRLQGKTDLFNLLSGKQKDEMRETGLRPTASNKVFVVRNPGKELQRIQDANSDVIDAARAYLGELDLIAQTEATLKDVETALDAKNGSRVLLEGPARSGKTVIAMSLLSKYSDSKMLLMNWYFYDALADAFRIWGDMEVDEIKKLFTTDPGLLQAVREKEHERASLDRFVRDPELLACEIKMREWPTDQLSRLPRWIKLEGEGDSDWRLSNITKSSAGDYVFVYAPSAKTLRVIRLTEVFKESRTAKGDWVYSYSEGDRHSRNLENPEENERELAVLRGIRDAIEESTVDELLATLLKGIADALSSGSQRFFHHDRRQSEGLWVDGRTILIPDTDTIICDEAQRLGSYKGLDEVAELANRPGSLFLCGDDCQRLNRIGDLGIARLMQSSFGEFTTFELPESVGIPAEVGTLVKSLLGECDAPAMNSSFKVKLIFNDDLSLVSAFESDPSYKKHYAIPNSTGFYNNGYTPGIVRSASATPECTDKCDSNCAHRFIPMLSQELGSKFKFFCAEAIMPNYALSAYELISREVESVYLKIPRQISIGTLKAPIDGDAIASWIKRHLYVLMTRATANLVINVEDERLYESFRRTCEEAGLTVE